MEEMKTRIIDMTSPLQLHQDNYFFFEELFLDSDLIISHISKLREFEEVPTEELFANEGTLSHESSVTIVMASCSWALAIERVTTENLGDFDFLLLRWTPTAVLLEEVSILMSRKSAKVSSESAEWTEGVEVL